MAVATPDPQPMSTTRALGLLATRPANAARIARATGAAFNGVEIDFTAGYCDAVDVPAPLAQAILQLAAHRYETR